MASSSACKSFKRAGVGTNGILECKCLSGHVHHAPSSGSVFGKVDCHQGYHTVRKSYPLHNAFCVTLVRVKVKSKVKAKLQLKVNKFTINLYKVKVEVSAVHVLSRGMVAGSG
jgi:hypothetical protein